MSSSHKLRKVSKISSTAESAFETSVLHHILTNTGERGNYNYLLKCTDGIFSGKFLYINTTPDGELFGSGDPDTIDLTMYIESAELSEKHAEIKFVDGNRYILRDCGSDTGTWVRINREVDLYSQNRRRVYKVHDYHFVIEESTPSFPSLIFVGTDYFDEVSCWLRAHGFIKYAEILRSRGITQLRDVPKYIKRADIKKVRKFRVMRVQVEAELSELDRFFTLIDDLENDDIIQK